MKDEELKLEEIEASHTRWSRGSHQGRGEWRGRRCYPAVIHPRYLNLALARAI